ncbi:MAG: hypothetical protein P9E67_16465 [Candidatus Competibacter sp.]|nr:hypothetical protein [Candidatus Competibacter sp.]
MTDSHDEQRHDIPDEAVARERRDFLRGLGKWSQAAIGGVLLGGGLMASHRASAGAWVNRRGGYGGGWINGGGGGGWINGGGGGGWINGGGGGGWINRRGGGGGGWINRR